MSKSNSQGGGAERILWLDAVRCLAIISITFNHALSRSFSTQKSTLKEFEKIPIIVSLIKAILYTFSRVGVPLFLMLTGILMIKRDFSNKEVLNKFIKHNWVSLFITTEIWLAIMYFQLSFGDLVLNYSSSALTEFVANFVLNQLFLNQTTMGSMWYMPMILCVYLMIPVASIAIKNINRKYILLLVAFAAALSMLIPNLNTIVSGLGIEKSFKSAFTINDLFSIYFIYVVLGYYIGDGLLNRIKNKWVILGGGIVSFGLTALFQFWIYSSPIDYYLRYRDIGILISACFLLECFRRWSQFLMPIKKQIIYLSSISFGIYFVHICIMTYLHHLIGKKIQYLQKFLLLESVSFIGAIIIIYFLSKISIFKKYLFMIKR